VAKVNLKHRDTEPHDRPTSVQYAASGHPSIEQLMAEQGTGPITDVSVEEFVATIREWRGHKRTDQSA
jgi:hypothetical protein